MKTKNLLIASIILILSSAMIFIACAVKTESVVTRNTTQELIIKIAAPEKGEKFGVISLNDEIVKMEDLAEKFQNAPNEFRKMLTIQSEWNVPNEQIVQIMDIAKRCGIDKIGFVRVKKP